MHKKRFSKYRATIMFFRSFLLVMLLSIACTVYLYVRIESVIYEDLYNQRTALLEHASSLVDARLGEIDNIITSLSVNRDVYAMRGVRNPRQQKSSVYTVSRFAETLSNYNINSGFVRTLYLYFGKSSIVVSPFDTYLDSGFFYEHFFKIDGLSSEGWHDMMRFAPYSKKFYPSTAVTSGSSASRCVLCVRSLYPYGQGDNAVSILLLIQEDQLLELMLQDELSKEGHSAILDYGGNVLAATDRSLDWQGIAAGLDNGGSEFTIGGQEMYAFSAESSDNDWRYLNVLPSTRVMQRLTEVKALYVFALLLFIVFGTILSYGFAYRYSKPIAEMDESLRAHFGGQERFGLNYLRNRTRELIKTQTDMRSWVEERMPMMQSAFITTLLRGEMLPEVATDLASQVGIQNPYEYYLVFSVHIGTGDARLKGEKSAAAVRALILSGMEHTLAQEDGPDRLVLIRNLDRGEEADPDELDAQVGSVVSDALREYGVDLLFAAGNIVRGLHNVCYSFFQSRAALDYKVLGEEKSFIRFSDIPSSGDSFYYPREMESRLANLLVQGDLAQAEALLSDIFRQNQRLSPDALKLFTGGLCVSLSRAADILCVDQKEQYAQLQDRIFSIFTLSTVGKQHEVIREIARALCEEAANRRSRGNSALIGQILDRIHRDFSDPSMSLASVAQRFSMNEVYLSQYFKEKTSVNFSVYLENIRMQAAEEYLLGSARSIDEISAKVGYNSAPVFRTAFKRRHGVSPLSFRRNASRL